MIDESCVTCDALCAVDPEAFIVYAEILSRNGKLRLKDEGLELEGDLDVLGELVWQIKDHYAALFTLAAHMHTHLLPVGVDVFYEKERGS